MNSNTIKEFAVVVLAVVVGLFLFSFGSRVTSSTVGGGVTNFGGDLTVENLIANGTATITGAISLSSTLSTAGLLTLNAGQLNSYTNSTSTTATSYTLVTADILNYDTVLLTPNVGDLTLTFPASSTASTLVPSAGDMQETCFYNATTTAGIDITFAAGTGIDLETASSSPTDLTLLAGNTACFKFVRQPATASTFDISALMTEYTNGD